MADSHDSVQIIQEDEYVFPYHHIVSRRGGFSQCFNDAWGINYLATVEYLLGRLRAETFRSAVDIGCGDGRFTKELQQTFPEKRIAGVDYSERAIALARAMTPGVEFQRVDITDGSFRETFDLAMLMEVYEHVPPRRGPAFLDAVADLLNDGGMLYVTVPHSNKPVEPKHYRHFSSESLMAELDARFELLEMIPIERRAAAKWWIDFALTNGLFVLNHRRVAGALYSFYKRRLFLAPDERTCQRLVLRLRKRRPNP